MKDKIIVLGSKGMLGQMVARYFCSKGYQVETFDERFSLLNRKSYSEYLRSIKSSILINCIGKIRQKTEDGPELLLVNALFPAELRNCLNEEIILVRPSTDCIFSGDA